jgi:hypothetical protein
MSIIDNITWRLSGGAANSDPSASLGGAKSSHRVLSQQASGLSAVTGVAIDYAHSNSIGNGTLAFTAAGTTLAWTCNGDSAGTPVAVSGDGVYHLKSGNGSGTLTVTVTASGLPGSNQSDAIAISRHPNLVFDDIGGLEGYNGDAEYRCLYLQNDGGDTYQLQVWISYQPAGDDTLEIGLDAGGVNGVATTVANENAAPAGVSFSSPATEGAALTVTLAAGDFVALWLRRSISPAQRPELAEDWFRVAISAIQQ